MRARKRVEFQAPPGRWTVPRAPRTLSIELETLATSAAHEAFGAPARGGRVRAAWPWDLADEDWQRLAPRGTYARLVRSPFLLAATLVLVLPAVCLALPIALVTACVHGGPRKVLFAQRRVGWRGRPFVLYKFRTLLDQPGDDHARATRFGRFLRNTHLDELPQLWNVLAGDMSLIGPRPEMLSTERWAARHCPQFRERLVLKPGLTGYAQVTQGYTDHGDAEAYRTKLELNRRYGRELGWRLDCAILLRTALWMLRGRGWRRRQ